MPSDNGQSIVHFWAGCGYPVGWLFSSGRKRVPKPWLPYAIDNGCYGSHLSGEWSEDEFMETLAHFSLQELKPRWAAVPDKVGDAEETKRLWRQWHPKLSRLFPFKWAFVVQDGMVPSDVPPEASIVFVGGSKKWKWRTAHSWVSHFERVHVGAVNCLHYLSYSEELKVESVDGTGWFRSPRMTDKLTKWFRHAAGQEKLPEQLELKVS